MENKSTQKGRKLDKQPTWQKIQTKIPGKSVKQIEDCWKNIRKRAIEKKKDLDEQRNMTGGGVAKKVAALTELDEKVLSIIKYAEPITGINDSNYDKNTEISESDSDLEPLPKRPKHVKSFPGSPKFETGPEIIEVSATQKIAMSSAAKSQEQIKWIRHVNALKSYHQCLSMAQISIVPEEIIQLSRMHLANIIDTAKSIYGENAFTAVDVCSSTENKENEQPGKI